MPNTPCGYCGIKTLDGVHTTTTCGERMSAAIERLREECETMHSRTAEQFDRAETTERELAEARADTVRLDWLLDTLRGARSPTWTRDNFIKGSSNDQVRASIDATLPYDKRPARSGGEGETNG